MTRIAHFSLVLMLVFAMAAGADEPCPTCGDEPRFPEETAFLAAHGYAANDYTILMSWSELSRNGSGQYVTGYRVKPTSGGKPFDLYSDGTDALLSTEQVAALGIPPKNWDLPPAERSAELPAPLGKALPPPPVPVGPANAVGPSAGVVAPVVDVAQAMQEDEAERLTGGKGPQRIGLNVALDQQIIVRGQDTTDGAWQSLPGGGWLWSMSLFSPDALGMRVHFSELALPPGAQVIVYNYYAPQEAYGPYFGPAEGRDDLWSATAFADGVVVECLVPEGVDRNAVRLTIDRVTHNYVALGDVAWAKAAGACNLDVTCYAGWVPTSKAVGGIGSVGSAGALWCTGSLLADSELATTVPYLLTANHCINAADAAASVEIYWLYQTPTCLGTPPNILTVPRTTGGSVLLATSPASTGTDFTLLRLNNPAAAGVTYAGWLSTPNALGTATVCIHHPSGDYKRISFGTITDVAETWRATHPADRYYQSSWTAGVTEPGSSGSPLFNGSTEQVIGQLWGGPSSCAPEDTKLDYYGRFDVSYPLMEAYLGATAAPPPSDSFAARPALVGFPVSAAGSNVAATAELTEPAFVNRGRSVWWSWTAPQTGSVSIDTVGSNFDTVLGVYTGTTLAALSIVAEDDDSAEGLQSRVVFSAVSGTVYNIAVDGYAGASGNIVLNIGALQLSYTIDLYANPTDAGTVTGGGIVAGGSSVTVLASPEWGYYFVNWTEDTPEGPEVSASPEYSFTATSDRTLVANFMPNYPDEFQIWLSASPTEGGNVYGEGPYLGGSPVTVQAVPSANYYFVNWTEGGAEVSTDPEYAFMVSGDRFLVANFARLWATIGNPTVFSQPVQNVNRPAMPFTMFENGVIQSVSMYHAPGTGNMILGVYANGANNLPGARLGLTATTPVSAAAGWQTIPLTSPVPVTAGQTIWLAWVYQNLVTVYYQAGSPGRAVAPVGWAGGMPNPFGTSNQANNIYSIYATYAPDEHPANDDFVNRISISAPAQITATNIGATAEAGEPYFVNWGKSVWWSWTAPQTGSFSVDTIGSNFDTLLGVYIGTALGALSAVAEDDDSGGSYNTSRIIFDAIAGTTYVIAVDGYAGASGNIKLNLSSLTTVFTITLGTSPTDGGSVSGGGSFTAGTTIAVHASANPGFQFVLWTEDSMPVSTDPDYAFVVTADRHLVANFERIWTTIGNGTVFSQTVQNANRPAMPFTMTENGTLQSISMYHGPGTGNMILGVYANGANSLPGTRLGLTATTPVSASEGWQTIPLTSPVPVVAGQTIWLAWVYQNLVSVRYQAGSPGRALAPVGWAGGMPNPFGTSTQSNNIYSIFATYEPAPPTVQFSQASSSGSEATTPANLEVTLSPASTETVTVQYAVTGGSATGGGVDYTLASGQLTFAAGQTAKPIALAVVNDALPESDETVVVTLSAPSNAALGSQVVHTYTIQDNDSTPSGTIGNTTVFSQMVQNVNRPAMPFTMTENGTLQSISMYHGPGTGNMILGVYANGANNLPGARLGLTATTPVSASAGWQTIPLTSPVPVAAGQTIWLAWVYQNLVTVRYQSGSPGRALAPVGWASGMPNPFGTSTQSNSIYSIYATYTTSAPTTIGNTTVFSQTVQPVNRPAMPFVVPENGILESVSMYHGPGTGNMILGVYATGANSLPGARLGLTAATPVNAAAGWQTIPLTTPVPVTAGQTIWLAWVYENLVNVYYQAGSPGRAVASGGYAGGMPNPFGTSTQANNVYSIYATYAAPGPGLFNDDFSARALIPGTPAQVTGSNVDATAEPDEPGWLGRGRSVWWSWTAPQTGGVTVDTDGSDFNTVLGVFTGSALDALTMVAYDTSSGPGGSTSDWSSKATFHAIGGTTYCIAVDGYAEVDFGTVTSGNITLNISAVAPGPPNDNFSERTEILTTPASVDGTNAGATSEYFEWFWYYYTEWYFVNATNGKTVWWEWTAPLTGSVTIDTDGSDFDTAFAIYTGTSADNLDMLWEDYEGNGAAVIDVIAGETFCIAVDGYPYDLDGYGFDPPYGFPSGNITLNISSVQPASTIGNTTVFSQTVQNANRPAMPFTVTQSGSLGSVSMYHGPGTGNMILGIYANGANNLPGARLGLTAATPVSASEGWQTIPLTSPVAVTAGQTIWLAWVYQNLVTVHYQAGSPGRALASAGYAAGMPDPFGSSVQGNTVYSIYATYASKTGQPSGDKP